jgi:RNA polymerase sigma-70 factor (ECF subfamily)
MSHGPCIQPQRRKVTKGLKEYNEARKQDRSVEDDGEYGLMADRGNVKAWFGQSVEENMDSLFSVALRLTRNIAEAEDLVAESVSKAWVAVGTLEDQNRFRQWMFRILHNCFISDYRKKSVRPCESSYDELSVAEGKDEIGDLVIQQSNEFMYWWANPEKEFVNSLLGEDIMMAIDSLPDVFRATILLVNVEGLSYDDTAKVLGVPPGTVRSRMKRGRTLLQKALWQQARDEGLVGCGSAEGKSNDD